MALRSGAIVTSPVWACLLMLAAARLSPGAPSPAPAPPPSSDVDTTLPPDRSGEIHDLKNHIHHLEDRSHSDAQRISDLEAKLSDCKQHLSEASDKIQDLQRYGNAGAGPFQRLFDSCSQFLVSVFFAVLGVAGVLGPMSFWHVYQAAAGSGFAGVLFIGSLNYFAGASGTWSASVAAILSGRAGFFNYLACLLFVAAGILRWYLKWEWLVYAVVDDIYMSRPMADDYVDARRLAPLLGQRGGGSCNGWSYKAPTLGKKKPQKNDAASEESSEVGSALAPAPAPVSKKNKLPPTSSPTKKSSPAKAQPARGAGAGLPSDGDQEEALDRLLAVVRSAGPAGQNDPTSKTNWHIGFWENVAGEVAQGSLSVEAISALLEFGFDPNKPSMSPPPTLLPLYRALEVCRTSASEPPAAAAAAAAALAPSPKRLGDIEVDSV